MVTPQFYFLSSEILTLFQTPLRPNSVSNPSTNPVCVTYETYLESDHFSMPPLLPPQSYPFIPLGVNWFFWLCPCCSITYSQHCSKKYYFKYKSEYKSWGHCHVSPSQSKIQVIPLPQKLSMICPPLPCYFLEFIFHCSSFSFSVSAPVESFHYFRHNGHIKKCGTFCTSYFFSYNALLQM